MNIMKIFESKLANRIAVSKWIGALFWILWLIFLPVFFPNGTMMFGWGIFAWYITLGGIIWMAGLVRRHPVFDFKIPAWIRWGLIWAWMCFVLALLSYNQLESLFVWTSWEWHSPFWLIIEWIFFWIICDVIATKICGDGKKLLK